MSENKKKPEAASAGNSESANLSAPAAVAAPAQGSGLGLQEVNVNGEKIRVMPVFDETTRFLYSKIGQGIRTIDDRLEKRGNPYAIPPSLLAVTHINVKGEQIPVEYMMLEKKGYARHEWCADSEPVSKHRPEWAEIADLVWGADGFAEVGDLLICAMDKRIYEKKRRDEIAEGQRRVGPMQQKGPDGRPWDGDRPRVHEAHDPFNSRDGVGINLKEHRGPMPVAVAGIDG